MSSEISSQSQESFHVQPMDLGNDRLAANEDPTDVLFVFIYLCIVSLVSAAFLGLSQLLAQTGAIL